MMFSYKKRVMFIAENAMDRWLLAACIEPINSVIYPLSYRHHG
ncbi:hypothetical protein M917_1991 [Psychrobacter aquaticus CMS 56]|uniref:Uncharacterized protein n=1 Tax=Psychrobacter aquaticus CMS 56 TaxID=1354303 RepID=U4T9V0_9GAMM|nr:hypothetical protein M917_1991 [Psychrobacter aquaticus CMS 56]